jgi:hypothetical protein
MTSSVVYFWGFGMLHLDLGWDIVNYQRSVDSVQTLTFCLNMAVIHMVVLIHRNLSGERFQSTRSNKDEREEK